MKEGLAEFGPHIYRAKDIAAGAMIKAGDGAENFALGSFAGTRLRGTRAMRQAMVSLRVWQLRSPF